MKVHWTLTALDHLTAIHDYIARDAPSDARAVVERVAARSRQIGRFPWSGRAVPDFGEEDLREVIEAPYRIIYRVTDERVDVLAVVHSSQEAPRLA